MAKTVHKPEQTHPGAKQIPQKHHNNKAPPYHGLSKLKNKSFYIASICLFYDACTVEGRLNDVFFLLRNEWKKQCQNLKRTSNALQTYLKRTQQIPQTYLKRTTTEST